MIEHPQIIFAALILFVAALVALLFVKLPGWSRPGLFFAVSVAPSFRTSEDAQKVLRSYRTRVIAHIGCAFALIAAGALWQRFVVLVFGLLWLIAGPLAAVSSAHKKVLSHAVAIPHLHDAPPAPRSGQLPGGWMLQLGPFGILLATAAYLRLHWDEIPNRFPVHWDADGAPNGWSIRTPADVYGPLAFGAVLVAAISLLALGIALAARRIPPTPGAPRQGDRGHRIAIVMVGIEFFVAAMFAIVGLLPFSGSPGVAPVVILALAILVAVFFFRHGFRAQADAPAIEVPGDGTPDSCWKFGLFYFNPADSALLVEKRIGIGYTLNFAHATAWLLMAITLLIPLAIVTLVAWRR